MASGSTSRRVSTRPGQARAACAALAVVALVAVTALAVTDAAGETTVTQTFGYSLSTQTFTVPPGVTSLNITLTGGQGGRGGTDSAGPSPEGGFVGQVRGTIAVTPGQELTLAVGSGGASGTGGGGVAGGTGGLNPLPGYGGGIGGASGTVGSSGSGGGGGAATVLRVGDVDVVAGGSGGSGGSGQYAPIIGRLAEDHFVGRPDQTATDGRPGLSANEACAGTCDGGGSGAGGGGAQGGDRGQVQYGGATATEWFGFGGYPGENSSGGFGGLSGSYQYVATNNAAGSITITYVLGVPDPPRSVVAAPGDGSLEVFWLEPLSSGIGPITDYVVRWATDPSGPWTTVDGRGSTETRSTITGLANGSAYYLQVLAVNALGESDPSAAWTFPATPSATPPAHDTLLHALGGDTSVSLQWSALAPPAGDVVDHVVQFATGLGGPWTTVDHDPLTATAIEVTGLTNGTPYLFRVAPETPEGPEEFSNLAEATPYGSPSAPSITSITPSASTLTVAFDAPDDDGGSPITGYEYRLDGGDWISAGQTSSPIAISGLTNGQTYSVQLRAVTAVADGEASAPAEGTPFGVPGLVPGFIAMPGADSVTLEWDAAPSGGTPVTTYNVIEWSAASAGSIVQSRLVDPDDFTTTFTGLAAGTRYFTIEATNAAGTGPRTPIRVTAVVGGTPPAAPQLDELLAVESDVELAWTSGAPGSAAISGYVVRYLTDDDTRSTLALSLAAASEAEVALPSATDTYRLQVAESSAAGTGPFTTVRPPIAVSGDTSAAGPLERTLSGTANPNGQSATLSFQLATAADELGTPDGIDVDASPDQADGSDVVPITATATGLEPGSGYHVRATARAGVMTAHGATVEFSTQAGIATTGLTKVYDGSPLELESTTTPAGLELARSFTGIDGTEYGPTATPPSEGGTYRVTSTITSPGQSGTEVVPATISAAPQTVTVVDAPSSGTVGETINPALSTSSGLPATLSVVVGSSAVGGASAASAPSGTAVTTASVDVCEVDGPQVHLTGPGTCRLRASQAGNRNYAGSHTDVTIEVAGVATPPAPPAAGEDQRGAAFADPSAEGTGAGSGGAGGASQAPLALTGVSALELVLTALVLLSLGLALVVRRERRTG